MIQYFVTNCQHYFHKYFENIIMEQTQQNLFQLFLFLLIVFRNYPLDIDRNLMNQNGKGKQNLSASLSLFYFFLLNSIPSKTAIAFPL